MSGSRGSWASLIQVLSSLTLRITGITGRQVDGSSWRAILKERCDQTEGVPINYWGAEMRLDGHSLAHCPGEGEQMWLWWLNSEELTQRQLQNVNICKLCGCLALFRVLNTCIVFSSKELRVLLLQFPDLQGSKAGICPMKILFLLRLCKSVWNVHCYPAIGVPLLRWVTHPWYIRQNRSWRKRRKEKGFDGLWPPTILCLWDQRSSFSALKLQNSMWHPASSLGTG